MLTGNVPCHLRAKLHHSIVVIVLPVSLDPRRTVSLLASLSSCISGQINDGFSIAMIKTWL